MNGQAVITVHKEVTKLSWPCGLVALVDTWDVPLISKYSWRLKRNRKTDYFYVRANLVPKDHSGKQVFLHRVIMDAKPGQIVDHINWNTLDNRRSNLRFVTASENQLNQRPRRCKA